LVVGGHLLILSRRRRKGDQEHENTGQADERRNQYFPAILYFGVLSAGCFHDPGPPFGD
jgi:hypothetical protein